MVSRRFSGISSKALAAFSTAAYCYSLPTNVEIKSEADVRKYAIRFSFATHVANRVYDSELNEEYKWIQHSKYLDSIFKVMDEAIDVALNKGEGNDKIEFHDGVAMFKNTDPKTYTNANKNAVLLYSWIYMNLNNGKTSIDDAANKLKDKYKDVDFKKAVSDVKGYKKALELGKWLKNAEKHPNVEIRGGYGTGCPLKFVTIDRINVSLERPLKLCVVFLNDKNDKMKYVIDCRDVYDLTNTFLWYVSDWKGCDEYLKCDSRSLKTYYQYELNIQDIYDTTYNEDSYNSNIINLFGKTEKKVGFSLNISKLFNNYIKNLQGDDITIIIPGLLRCKDGKNRTVIFEGTSFFINNNDLLELQKRNDIKIKLSFTEIDGQKVQFAESVGNVLKNCNPYEISFYGSIFMPNGQASLKELFWKCSKLTKIYGLDSALEKTGVVESMNSMFNDCEALKEVCIDAEIKLKSNNLNAAFRGCKSLKKIIMPNFTLDEEENKEKIIYTTSMFDRCVNLCEIDMKGLDNPDFKVTHYGMYAGCDKLSEDKKPFIREETHDDND